MGAKKYAWHKVAADVAELKWTPGEIAEVEADGKKICIARWQDQWFGFAHSCPHAGAPMTERESGFRLSYSLLLQPHSPEP